ncbi:MAG: multiubiquitin domain-containing protein [Betaproteobacteria bacterium]|nr:multiubiquitin domain-containing protein [Betaproteobacteria bacterium]
MSNDHARNNPHDHIKEVTVVFNGRPKPVAKERLSFEEVITYAFDTPPSGDGVQFTIQYTHGHSDKPNGTLLEGESVMVQDGMEFDVTPTNRS